MIEVVPYRPEHLSLLQLSDEDNEYFQTLDQAEDRVQIGIQNSRVAGTIFSRDRVLCCLGFNLLWPGVGCGWVLPSRFIYEEPLGYSKIVRRYVGRVMEDCGLHRLQTFTKWDDAHDRWMRFLGFKLEGRAVKYSHLKKDYGLYARTSR